jgi:hypothetical protein
MQNAIRRRFRNVNFMFRALRLTRFRRKNVPAIPAWSCLRQQMRKAWRAQKTARSHERSRVRLRRRATNAAIFDRLKSPTPISLRCRFFRSRRLYRRGIPSPMAEPNGNLSHVRGGIPSPMAKPNGNSSAKGFASYRMSATLRSLGAFDSQRRVNKMRYSASEDPGSQGEGIRTFAASGQSSLLANDGL